MKTKLSSFQGEKDIRVEKIIATETQRLSELFNKSFLNCDDIIQLTGLGRDNVRSMMNSADFPITKIGNRVLVSILAFVTWQMTQ